jgi:hypothetical protein
LLPLLPPPDILVMLKKISLAKAGGAKVVPGAEPDEAED